MICRADGTAVDGMGDEELDDEEDEDKDGDQNLAVYDFDEGEEGGSGAGGDSDDEDMKPRMGKSGLKKITQTVSQAHMCNYCNYTSPKRWPLTFPRVFFRHWIALRSYKYGTSSVRAQFEVWLLTWTENLPNFIYFSSPLNILLWSVYLVLDW